ncbi:hypothetical protein ABH940_003583, partial [Streptacidiphilus sp. BW17]
SRLLLPHVFHDGHPSGAVTPDLGCPSKRTNLRHRLRPGPPGPCALLRPDPRPANRGAMAPPIAATQARSQLTVHGEKSVAAVTSDRCRPSRKRPGSRQGLRQQLHLQRSAVLPGAPPRKRMPRWQSLSPCTWQTVAVHAHLRLPTRNTRSLVFTPSTLPRNSQGHTMHPSTRAAPANTPKAPATARSIETSRYMPLGSRRTLHYPVPWKSPCLADHRARSGHGYRDAPHAADLQLSTDGLRSYGGSRLLRIVRSLTSNAPTACTPGPSPTPSGDGPTPAGVRIETRHPTTDLTTRTCAAAITTSGRCWSGPPVLSGPGPGESCGGNSDRSTIALSPGQSTTRSPRTTSHGGNDGSRPNARVIVESPCVPEPEAAAEVPSVGTHQRRHAARAGSIVPV